VRNTVVFCPRLQEERGRRKKEGKGTLLSSKRRGKRKEEKEKELKGRGERSRAVKHAR